MYALLCCYVISDLQDSRMANLKKKEMRIAQALQTRRNNKAKCRQTKLATLGKRQLVKSVVMQCSVFGSEMDACVLCSTKTIRQHCTTRTHNCNTKACELRSPSHSSQALARCFLLSKCHTLPRYISLPSTEQHGLVSSNCHSATLATASKLRKPRAEFN